jgi:hypothetical protein
VPESEEGKAYRLVSLSADLTPAELARAKHEAFIEGWLSADTELTQSNHDRKKRVSPEDYYKYVGEMYGPGLGHDLDFWWTTRSNRQLRADPRVRKFLTGWNQFMSIDLLG